jgi:flagellar motor protein MotB
LQTKANELKALKAKAEEDVREKEAAKKEVEERERAALAVHREREESERAKKAEEERQAREAEMRAVWDSLDVDKDGQLAVAEVQNDARFDQNRDGSVSVEEAK